MACSLGFYGDGISFRVVFSQSSDSESFLVVHTLFNQMDAREDSGRCRTCGACFWPFPNSSSWWWLISSIFLIRISCYKITHANSYYGAWPGWVGSVRVLSLTKIGTCFSSDFALRSILKKTCQSTFNSTISFSLLVLTTPMTTWFYSQNLSLLDTCIYVYCVFFLPKYKFLEGRDFFWYLMINKARTIFICIDILTTNTHLKDQSNCLEVKSNSKT